LVFGISGGAPRVKKAESMTKKDIKLTVLKERIAGAKAPQVAADPNIIMKEIVDLGTKIATNDPNQVWKEWVTTQCSKESLQDAINNFYKSNDESIRFNMLTEALFGRELKKLKDLSGELEGVKEGFVAVVSLHDCNLKHKAETQLLFCLNIKFLFCL
jgi:hypothetical protein